MSALILLYDLLAKTEMYAYPVDEPWWHQAAPAFSRELAMFAEPCCYIFHYLELLLKQHQVSNTIHSGDNPVLICFGLA